MCTYVTKSYARVNDDALWLTKQAVRCESVYIFMKDRDYEYFGMKDKQSFGKCQINC